MFRKPVFLAVFVISFALLATLFLSQVRKKDYYAEGLAAMEKDQYLSAIVFFSKVPTVKGMCPSKQPPEVVYNQGVCYYHLSQKEDALLNFMQVINVDSANYKFPVSYWIGKILFDEQDYSDAYEYFSTFIKYHSQDSTYMADAYMLRGRALFELGDMEGAVPDLSEAIKLDKTLGEAYLYRAKAFDSLKNPENALSDYDNAVVFQADNAQFTRARFYYTQGNFDACIRDCSGFGSFVLKAYALQAMGDYKQSNYYYDQTLLSLRSNGVDEEIIHYRKAINNLMLNQYDSALRDINQALLFHGEEQSGDMYRLKSFILMKSGKTDQIKPTLDGSIKSVSFDIKDFLQKYTLNDALI